MDFREIRCRVSPFDGTYIADTRPLFLNISLESEKTLPNQLVQLEIPLDRVRLAFINRQRNGRDVKLRLDMELMVDELIQIGKTGGYPNSAVCGLAHHRKMWKQIHIEIPRSVWLEKVLSNTQFGRVHIIELPLVPIENRAGLKKSFDALAQAQKLESEGYYQESVGKCRIALEPFFETVEKTDEKGGKKTVPALKAAWQTRLGKATYDWLNASFIALKGPANQAVHLSSTGFDQIETQMFLAVTTAVVAYAIKTQPEPAS